MTPLVLGTWEAVRESMREAASMDLARALNRASILWWSFVPGFDFGVDVEAALDGEGLQEVPGHVGGEAADYGLGEGEVDLCVSSAAEVQSHEGEGLVEGDKGVGHPDDARAVSKGLAKGPSKEDGNVLDCVVAVGVGGGPGTDVEVESAVTG